MREIKFRAWDKLRKGMILEDFFIGSNGRLYYYNSDERLCSTMSKIPMQFTGLLDKNGKEIYEGDIVKVRHPMAHEGGDFYDSVGAVFWLDGAWYHGNDCDRPPKTMFEWCEVIGNIYENPEMAK